MTYVVVTVFVSTAYKFGKALVKDLTVLLKSQELFKIDFGASFQLVNMQRVI